MGEEAGGDLEVAEGEVGGVDQEDEEGGSKCWGRRGSVDGRTSFTGDLCYCQISRCGRRVVAVLPTGEGCRGGDVGWERREAETRDAI